MTILVVDASNMAYRARYAYSLTNRGQDTSVTYGTLRMLMALIKEYKPGGILMCFDGGRPNYRTKLVPKYKAQRKHDDDIHYEEYIRQVVELQRQLPYFGIMCVRRSGIEADDLMFHASRMLDHSVLVTNDDDLLQAVNDNTWVLKPKKKPLLITLDNFWEETGIPKEWYLTAKVLVGDSSDNIPGVVGVGPATIKKMFGKNPDVADTTKLQKGLQERIEQFISSGAYQRAHQCASLDDDLSGARYTLLNSSWMPYNGKQVYKYCLENDFGSLIEAGSLGLTFKPLQKPEFSTQDIRFPYIWDTVRHPSEEAS